MAINPNSLANLQPFKVGKDPKRDNNGRKVKYLTDLLNQSLKRRKDIILEGTNIETNVKGKFKVEGKTKEDVINALIVEAANGNIQAIKEILDRVEGKAIQAVELTGKDGEPIQHQVIIGMQII